MIIWMWMLIPLTQQTLIVDKIETQSGYAILKTNEIEVPKDFQIILHIIDPEEILNLVDNIEDNLNLAGKIQQKQIILDEIELIRNKIYTIIPNKYRRGLINGGGTLLKWIFGTMDNNDKLDIEKHLSTIDINNHNIITSMKQQIQINDNFQKSILQLKDAIDNDRKQILLKINSLNSLQYELYKNNLFTEQMRNLNIIKSRVEHIQESIASVRLGLLNPNILTKEEIKKYNIDFKKLVHIRLGVAKILEKKITFAIKIPTNYIILNKKLILPIPNLNNKIINEKRKYSLERNGTYFEFNTEKSYKELIPLTTCIFSSNCKLINSNSKNKILELDDNVLILENCNNLVMNSNCDERKFVLNGNFFIDFINCNISINNQTFSNEQNIFTEKFVLPNIKSELFNNSLTFEETILETQNNIKEIIELKYHKIANYGMSTLIIIIVIINCIFFYKKQKKENNKVNEIQENAQSKGGGVKSSNMTNAHTHHPNKSRPSIRPEFVEMIRNINSNVKTKESESSLKMTNSENEL